MSDLYILDSYRFVYNVSVIKENQDQSERYVAEEAENA